MKFIVSSSELYTYLQLLNKVIPSRSIMQIIENFLFEVQNNRLKITATDLESTLIANFELSNVEGEGTFAIDAKRLLDIIKEFSEQPLTFELNEETSSVLIRTETGKYSMPVFTDIDQYPQPTPIDTTQSNSFVIEPYILHKAITSTIYAVAEDELRPIMNGIFFEITPEYTTFVASDSHKLIRYRRKDVVADNNCSFVLPVRPAELLKSILPKAMDIVNVDFNEKNAKFSTTNYTLICRLIEGKYPDYERVIPTNNDKEAQIDRQMFLTSIRRVSLFSNEANKLVQFNFNSSQVEISAQDIDFSISATENLPCLFSEESFSIAYKSTFLTEVLSNINAKDVTISFLSKKTPTLVYPSTKDDENEDIVKLVMPMTLDDEE